MIIITLELNCVLTSVNTKLFLSPRPLLCYYINRLIMPQGIKDRIDHFCGKKVIESQIAMFKNTCHKEYCLCEKVHGFINEVHNFRLFHYIMVAQRQYYY